MPELLAQDRDGGGWGGLIYLAVFVLLPMLNKLGKKLRERFGKEQEDEVAVPELDAERPPAARPREAAPRRPSIPPVLRRTQPHDLAQSRVIVTPPRDRPPIARPVARLDRDVPGTPPPAPRRRPRPARAIPPPAETARQVSPTAEIPAGGGRATAPGDSARDAKARLLPSKLRAADLRSAVVLSEILQPPLALRSPE